MPSAATRIPPPPSPKRNKDEHEQGALRSFGVVYANELARPVLAGQKSGPYPVGSVIVREKLSAADAARPDLLAVMIKRARGFNPKGGDWEFLTADGALTKISKPHKKDGCLQCHASQRETDYVYPLGDAKHRLR